MLSNLAIASEGLGYALKEDLPIASEGLGYALKEDVTIASNEDQAMASRNTRAMRFDGD